MVEEQILRPAPGLKEHNAAEAVLKSFSRFLRTELLQVFLLRISPLIILYGGLLFGTAVHGGLRDSDFFAWWMIIGCLIALFLLSLRLKLSLDLSCFVVFVCVCLTVGWWFLVVSYGGASLYSQRLLLGLAVVAFGFMPWPLRHNICLALTFLMVGLASAMSVHHSLAFFVFCGMLIFVALGFSAENYLIMVGRSAHAFLARYCESSASLVVVLLRLLARQLAYLVSSDRVLVVSDHGAVELIHLDSIKSLEWTKGFAQGLCDAVHEQRAVKGLLRTERLAEGLRLALTEAFRFLPRRLFFVSFYTVADKRETRVHIILPLNFGVRFAGLHNHLRAFESLIAHVQITMNAARGRFISSDALTQKEQAILQREDELNQVVHHVNNAAQDLNGICEELNRAEAQKNMADLTRSLHGLELTIAGLSAGVSDVKLLSELRGGRSFPRQEVVPLRVLVEELTQYAAYLNFRGWGTLQIDFTANAAQGVRVVSREYLLAALRYLLRDALPRNPAFGCSLKISESDNVVSFSFISEYSAAAKRDSGDLVGTPESAWLPVLNLAARSGGTFSRPLELNEQFRLTLASAAIAAVESSAKVRWALFADDNPQVLSFYAKVGEALGIRVETALSLEKAEEILNSRGAPDLVVSDLQFADGSGTTLLKKINDRFGERTKTIVVSGVTDGHLKSRLLELGARRVLTKPVSRARLFSEINEVLNGK